MRVLEDGMKMIKADNYILTKREGVMAVELWSKGEDGKLEFCTTYEIGNEDDAIDMLRNILLLMKRSPLEEVRL